MTSEVLWLEGVCSHDASRPNGSDQSHPSLHRIFGYFGGIFTDMTCLCSWSTHLLFPAIHLYSAPNHVGRRAASSHNRSSPWRRGHVPSSSHVSVPWAVRSQLFQRARPRRWRRFSCFDLLRVPSTVSMRTSHDSMTTAPLHHCTTATLQHCTTATLHHCNTATLHSLA